MRDIYTQATFRVNNFAVSVISGFRHEVEEKCDLLGYYPATVEDGIDSLSRNVGKELLLLALQQAVLKLQRRKNRTSRSSFWVCYSNPNDLDRRLNIFSSCFAGFLSPSS